MIKYESGEKLPSDQKRDDHRAPELSRSYCQGPDEEGTEASSKPSPRWCLAHRRERRQRNSKNEDSSKKCKKTD
jgi:hypothetical protein